jgi:hypothetical protein
MWHVLKKEMHTKVFDTWDSHCGGWIFTVLVEKVIPWIVTRAHRLSTEQGGLSGSACNFQMCPIRISVLTPTILKCSWFRQLICADAGIMSEIDTVACFRIHSRSLLKYILMFRENVLLPSSRVVEALANIYHTSRYHNPHGKRKGKAIPVTGRGSPYGCETSR